MGDRQRGTDARLAHLAAAMASDAAQTVARDLAVDGIPVMVLKGPPVQQRFLGTDTAYPSADVDLLVLQRAGRATRRRLTAGGWDFLPANGLLWRLDRAAAYTRKGVVIDLHWGLHAYTVSARQLRPLERSLWERAHRSPEGWFEPRPEALFVYLAVHASGRGFYRANSLQLIGAVAKQVDDWALVESIARSTRTWGWVEPFVTAARRGDVSQVQDAGRPGGRRSITRLLRTRWVPSGWGARARKVRVWRSGR